MFAGNVELIREVSEAGNRGGWDALFRVAHPDIEWETDPRQPDAGTYRGREEIRRFYEDQTAPFDRLVIEPERLIANGDYVVALLGVRCRLRDSTAEIELRLGHLWTIRDGKVVRGQAFAETVADQEKALPVRAHGRRAEVRQDRPRDLEQHQAIRKAERQLAAQAEASYKRLVTDQRAAAPARKVGASATPEHV